MRKALKGMSRRERKRLARDASRNRSPLRTVAIVVLILLIILFLIPYFL